MKVIKVIDDKTRIIRNDNLFCKGKKVFMQRRMFGEWVSTSWTYLSIHGTGVKGADVESKLIEYLFWKETH